MDELQAGVEPALAVLPRGVGFFSSQAKLRSTIQRWGMTAKVRFAAPSNLHRHGLAQDLRTPRSNGRPCSRRIDEHPTPPARAALPCSAPCSALAIGDSAVVTATACG